MGIVITSGVKIESDFTDYYDELSSENNSFTYKRYRKNCLSRAKALKYIKSKGINVLELKPVQQFIKQEFPLVVYEDTYAHDGTGKKIINYEEGMNYYNNYLASRLLKSDDNKTIKYIQLGQRRFTIMYENKTYLELGGVVDIKESQPSYNQDISLPIYSIDYITVDGTLVATDFNEVENFKLSGLTNFLPAETVVDEIRNGLIKYNQI